MGVADLSVLPPSPHVSVYATQYSLNLEIKKCSSFQD